MKSSEMYSEQTGNNQGNPDVKPQAVPPDCPAARPESQPEHEHPNPLKQAPEISPQPNHPLNPPSKQNDPGGNEHAFRDVIRMYPAAGTQIKHRLMNLKAGYKISDLLRLYGFVA